MTIQEFHDTIRTLMNPGQGTFFNPEEIDRCLLLAINNLFTQQFKHFEETQQITDELGFFKADNANSPALVTGGYCNIPDDCYYITNLEAVMSDNSVVFLDLITDGAWTRRKNSSGFPPSKDYPICRKTGSRLQVLPVVSSGVIGVAKVNIFYLRKPATPKYNYTEVDGYGFAYQDSGSVQVDYPEPTHPLIIEKALGYLGVPSGNNTLVSLEKIKAGSQ